MIQVRIDQSVVARAIDIARQEDILPSGSVDRSLSQKGRRAVWEGAVGQAVFEAALAALGIPCEFKASIFYDYQTPAGRVEVKTKERAVAPAPSYEASIYDYNKDRQDADWYAFVSLRLAEGRTKESEARTDKYDTGWVCGCIARQEFTRSAFEVNIGDPLPNGQAAGFASRNIRYSALDGLEVLRGNRT